MASYNYLSYFGSIQYSKSIVFKSFFNPLSKHPKAILLTQPNAIQLCINSLNKKIREPDYHSDNPNPRKFYIFQDFSKSPSVPPRHFTTHATFANKLVLDNLFSSFTHRTLLTTQLLSYDFPPIFVRFYFQFQYMSSILPIFKGQKSSFSDSIFAPFSFLNTRNIVLRYSLLVSEPHIRCAMMLQ